VTQVVVRKLKFDGSVSSEWDASLIEVLDEWLVTVFDSDRHAIRDDLKREGLPHIFVLHYLSTNRPLVVQIPLTEAGEWAREVKIDAALPAVCNGNVIDFVDLDLDVIVLPGGAHYVRDQDVFAERSVTMNYSEEAKRQAHLGILHALRMVRRKQFPFDGHAERLAATFS
jgi:protein associated with RNAse G/E